MDHLKLAKQDFNKTWEYIDMKDRTEKQNEEMINTALSSREHWSHVGNASNFAIGDWQISKVYTLVGNGEKALEYAKKGFDNALETNDAFLIAFAYESIARSYMVLRDKENLEINLLKAEEVAKEIDDKGNREYLLGELKTIALS